MKYTTLVADCIPYMLDSVTLLEKKYILDIRDSWMFVVIALKQYNSLYETYNKINKPCASYWNVPEDYEEPVFYDFIANEHNKTLELSKNSVRTVGRLYRKLSKRSQIKFDKCYYGVLLQENIICKDCDKNNFFVYKYI